MNKEAQSFEKISTKETLDSRISQDERHFGITMPIGILPNGEPKYVLGPHYLVFLSTLLITSIVFIVLGYNIISSASANKLWISLAVVLSLGFYIYSYFKVGISNPGIASSAIQLTQTDQKNTRYCRPCKIIRPLGTVHCFSCDVCIHGYDHHCPWIGKCVGRENLCDFKRFIFSVLIALCTFGACIYISQNAPSNDQPITN